MARTPLVAKVVADEFAELTTIVVSRNAPDKRVRALEKKVKVLVAPLSRKADKENGTAPQIDLKWLMKKLGAGNVTSLLVEGGGEVHESFLVGGLAQRVAFFYAPKVLGGSHSRKAVAGEGVRAANEIIELENIEWRKVGVDLFMTGDVKM